MLLADLARHELEHAGVDLDLAEVDRRQAVLLGDELGQLLVLDVTEPRQRRAQPLAGALGFFLRLLKLLKREHPLADQQLSDTAHSAVSPKRLWVSKGYRVMTGQVKRSPPGTCHPSRRVGEHPIDQLEISPGLARLKSCRGQEPRRT